MSPQAGSSMMASTRRKTRTQREAELTLHMLEDETDEEQAARTDREAMELIRFAENELEPEKYQRLLNILSENDDDGAKGITIKDLIAGTEFSAEDIFILSL